MVCKAALSGGDFLLWKSNFFDNCKETAHHNAQANMGQVNFEMLAGEGAYEDIIRQINYDPPVYAQIALAARNAWTALPSKGDLSSSLSNIRQGHDEPFSDFVHRLVTAAGRIFGNVDNGLPFVQQLAFENANKHCQAAIRPYKRKTDLSGYIRLCADIGPGYTQGWAQGMAMAAAAQGMSLDTFYANSRNKKELTCFGCKQPGHLKRDCPNKPSSGSRPSALCPKCRKGYHWASECRSIFDKEGKLIDSSQKNNYRLLAFSFYSVFRRY
ncbi:endogenous retrovirus group K member 10 Gag polyprotein-like [Fukomys damarensis]|uniref:endogenous retrovirus group K member 10 Gag polyprotein-like n=1 Tax=Fukomys damarensis TaxID=885580 RepID=UPI001455A7E5|nr:endogenous retrovirus group K member 10 Gag polyprotein-like [Fukomys damarensis]